MTPTDIFLKCFNEEITDLPIWFHSYRFVRQCGQVAFDLVFPSELNNEVYSFQRLMDMMKDEILETATGGQAKDIAEFGINHIATTRTVLGDVFDSSYLAENQIDSLSDLCHDLLWEWTVEKQ